MYREMILIGHRGFRINVQENTFNAFNTAFQLKLDYIEFDVQLSKDETLFILHDASLDRTMNASGKLSDLMTEDLEKITTKDGNFHIPKLSQVFQYKVDHPDLKTKFMIELKGPNSGVPTAKLIQQYHLEDHVVFSGRYLTELTTAHELCPNIPICLNITKCKDFTVSDLLKCNSVESFPLPFSMFSLKTNVMDSSAFIQQCHFLKTQALCWNFIDYTDPAEMIQKMIDWNIDGMLLDDPKTVAIARKYLP